MAGFPFTMAPFQLENTILLIGGIPINGFGTGDVIAFKPKGALFDSMAGADGKVIVFSTNEPRLDANIIVTSQSGSLRQLAALLNDQLVAGIVGLPFQFVDPSSGTTVFDTQAVFLNMPEQNFTNGNNFNRMFPMLLPNGMRPGNTLIGPALLLP